MSGRPSRADDFYIAEVTPKALANSSPGLERSDNPGIINSICG